jgi:site-specific recombinase XerD
LSIRHADVDLDHQVIKIVGKGGDERMITYGSKTMLALDRYLNLRSFQRYAHLGALWLSQQGAMATSTVRMMLRQRGEAAGLYMWPHRLRHQMAHEWLDDGGQERDLMKLAGWKSPAMLARYGAAAATQRAIDAHKEHGPGDKF